MHLLFTNNTLHSLAGSELYVYDMALELQRRGHRVSCFTLNPGLIANKLREQGISVATSVEEMQALPLPDLIHAHHRLEARLAASCFPQVPIVYACLGPFHPLEQPGLDRGLFTRFLAISQDVKANMVCYQQILAEKISVIPNFVDLSRFTAVRPLSKKPRRVLLLTNYFKTEGIVEKACKIAGDLELKAIGIPNGAVWNVEDYLDWADVVVTSARGALQALAMGRAVVVYRPTGSDGLLTPANFEASFYHNFSGRAFARHFDAATMAGEITSYKPAEVQELQERIRSEFSLPRAADSLLQLYQQTIDEYCQQWPAPLEAIRYRLILGELGRFLTGFKHQDNQKAGFIFTLGDFGKAIYELQPHQKELLQFLEDSVSEINNQQEARHTLEVHTNRLSARLRELEIYTGQLEYDLEQASVKTRWLESQNQELLTENAWLKQSMESVQAELQALLRTRVVRFTGAVGKVWKTIKPGHS